MKKILIVNDLVDGGGVEKLMYSFAAHWSQKYQVDFLIKNSSKTQRSKEKKCYRYYYYEPINGMLHIKGFRRLGDWINSVIQRLVFGVLGVKNYDYLIAMKEGTSIDCGQYIKAKKKFGWIHVDYQVAYWTYLCFGNKDQELNVLKKYDGIQCVSQVVKDNLIERIGDSGNLNLCYNPIDVDLIKYALTNEEEMCYWQRKRIDGKTLFVSIGRLHYQKGYDKLLMACKTLQDEGRPYELWIIGEGKDGSAIQALAKELKLNCVTFIGYLDNPYPVIAQGDWFISSSRYEGYSLVSQEAAVIGIPVIATECSGTLELLGECENGIVINHEVEDIYNAMKHVIGQPMLREHYAQKILNKSKEIDYHNRMKRIEEVLDME